MVTKIESSCARLGSFQQQLAAAECLTCRLARWPAMRGAQLTHSQRPPLGRSIGPLQSGGRLPPATLHSARVGCGTLSNMCQLLEGPKALSKRASLHIPSASRPHREGQRQPMLLQSRHRPTWLVHEGEFDRRQAANVGAGQQGALPLQRCAAAARRAAALTAAGAAAAGCVHGQSRAAAARQWLRQQHACRRHGPSQPAEIWLARRSLPAGARRSAAAAAAA